MQAVINGLGAINWLGHGAAAWNWAQAQATSGYAYVLALPATCNLAIVHAGMVCAGQTPVYVAIPGFAPLSYSWGWLLVGILVGSVMTLLVLALTGCLRREPTAGSLAAIAHMANQQAQAATQAPAHHGPPGLALPHSRATQDILAYIVTNGQPALRELAAAAGRTEVEFLTTLLGHQRPQQQLQRRGEIPWM